MAFPKQNLLRTLACCLALWAGGASVTRAQSDAATSGPLAQDTGSTEAAADAEAAATDGAAPAPGEAAVAEAPAEEEAVEAEPAEAAEESADPLVELEWGRGLTVRSEDRAFSLTIRGRIQALAEASTTVGTAEDPDPEESIEFMIRRARLVFSGNFLDEHLQYYVQLGLAPRDMEPDLLVPLRDAYVTWTGIENFQLRVGQMKVPFNRERVVSSSALQLVDRSAVNAELTLDRDVGVQIFGTDLFDLGGYLGYQIGIFGGEGRLRLNDGAGLLYVARLQIQPTGEFADSYVEADFLREDRARLSLGLGGAFNHESRRTRSTTGGFYELGGFDYAHAEFDFMFKWSGLSVMGEVLYRQSTGPNLRATTDPMTMETTEERAGNALGYFVQAGYMFEPMIEVAARYSEIIPLTSSDVPNVVGCASSSPAPGTVRACREMTLGLNWYPIEHNLKLQFDYTHISDPTEEFVEGSHRFRLQMQAYF